MTRVLLALSLALSLTMAGCSDEEPEAGSPSAERAEESPAGDPQGSPEPPPDTPPDSPVPEGAPPGEPAVAVDDPAAWAQQITEAERTIRSDDATDEELAAAGHLQQVAYRRLAAAPESRDQVLAGIPPELQGVAAAHVEAAAQLFALTTPQEQLPAWRIIAPPPPEELLSYYREAQEAFGVGWEYLASIHLIETRMGRIQGTSSAGAQGPMQFMPGTWEAYGEGDVHNPRDAILGAARYLAASGAPGNMDAALFAYNRSDAYVHAITTYAEQMRADPRTYRGYYHWQVYYRTVDGDKLLPVGYDGTS